MKIVLRIGNKDEFISVEDARKMYKELAEIFDEQKYIQSPASNITGNETDFDYKGE